MPDRLYVLDGSALLCLLFNEPGAELVEARLTHALVSAVNYHEVLAKLIDCGIMPEEAKALLGELDIDIIATNLEQADRGGILRSATAPAELSLAARSCLALAQAYGAVAVTANPHWATLDIGIEIEVVR